MGLPPGIFVHARHRNGQDRGNDPGEAAKVIGVVRSGIRAGLILALAVYSAGVSADPIRVATFNTELQRDGPGLFLRDTLSGTAADIEEAADRIAASKADVVLLQGIDFDHGLVALTAFADRVAAKGTKYSHLFALAPNTGLDTGLDLNGDGYRRGPRDAQAYGAFAGQGGMALLSVFSLTGHTDFTPFLWADLPQAQFGAREQGFDVQRLSSHGHWVVRIEIPRLGPVDLLAYHASPPVFDGPDDRNGRRNHDETAFWVHFLDGRLDHVPPTEAFILLGDANLDALDGDGRPDALHMLLNDKRLQDPRPSDVKGRDLADSEAAANTTHRGNPELDTANWRDDPGPGNLRVDYILPSADWTVLDAGVLWPSGGQGPETQRGSRHGLVWVDLDR